MMTGSSCSVQVQSNKTSEEKICLYQISGSKSGHLLTETAYFRYPIAWRHTHRINNKINSTEGMIWLFVSFFLWNQKLTQR